MKVSTDRHTAGLSEKDATARLHISSRVNKLTRKIQPNVSAVPNSS